MGAFRRTNSATFLQGMHYDTSNWHLSSATNNFQHHAGQLWAQPSNLAQHLTVSAQARTRKVFAPGSTNKVLPTQTWRRPLILFRNYSENSEVNSSTNPQNFDEVPAEVRTPSLQTAHQDLLLSRGSMTIQKYVKAVWMLKQHAMACASWCDLDLSKCIRSYPYIVIE